MILQEVLQQYYNIQITLVYNNYAFHIDFGFLTRCAFILISHSVISDDCHLIALSLFIIWILKTYKGFYAFNLENIARVKFSHIFCLTLHQWWVSFRFWELFILKCYKKMIIGLDEQTNLLSSMKHLENGDDFLSVINKHL